MSITPLRFTGVSSFSDDFQTILDRAVSIASLPLAGLQNNQADLITRKQLLTDLRLAVSDLAAAVSRLGTLGANKAVNVASSNSSKVSVTNSGAGGTGSYVISEITSVARAASATSAAGYPTAHATAVSEDGTLELVVGNKSYTVDLTAAGRNNLNGLRDAINGLGAGVTATVLNTGTGETPYYLSLTATTTGEQAFELRETAGNSASNRLVNTPPSSNARYTSNAGLATADATAVSSDGLLQLVIGASTYDLDVSGANHLNGVRNAINGLGAGVTAAVIHTGEAANPHKLSVVSASGATVALRETADDPATNLLTNAHQGANAVFKLNGLGVIRSDNVVSGVIPGVTFTILNTTGEGEQVTLSLSSSRAEVANALRDLATYYNALVDKVNAQVGQAAGLLSGDWIVRQVQNNLRALTAYRGSGAVKSLADLGIEMDSTGKMSFNSTKFYSLSNSELEAAFSYLGSATAGLGGFASSFTQLSDPISGLIKTQQDNYDKADARIATQIAALSERITVMQASLSRRLQLADTLLAQLESQQTMLDASLQSLKLVLFGKQKD